MLLQDAYDLMTGSWVPRRGWNPATLVTDRRPLFIRAVCAAFTSLQMESHTLKQVPYALFFSLFMICAGLTLPRSSGTYTHPLSYPPAAHSSTDYSLSYYFMFWFIIFLLSLVFIFAHGVEYVNWPRLLPLTDIIYYEGPGFRSGHSGKGFGIPALDFGRLSANAGRTARQLTASHQRAKSKLEEIEMGTKARVD